MATEARAGEEKAEVKMTVEAMEATEGVRVAGVMVVAWTASEAMVDGGRGEGGRGDGGGGDGGGGDGGGGEGGGE